MNHARHLSSLTCSLRLPQAITGSGPAPAAQSAALMSPPLPPKQTLAWSRSRFFFTEGTDTSPLRRACV